MLLEGVELLRPGASRSAPQAAASEPGKPLSFQGDSTTLGL